MSIYSWGWECYRVARLRRRLGSEDDRWVTELPAKRETPVASFGRGTGVFDGASAARTASDDRSNST